MRIKKLLFIASLTISLVGSSVMAIPSHLAGHMMLMGHAGIAESALEAFNNYINFLNDTPSYLPARHADFHLNTLPEAQLVAQGAFRLGIFNNFMLSLDGGVLHTETSFRVSKYNTGREDQFYLEANTVPLELNLLMFLMPAQDSRFCAYVGGGMSFYTGIVSEQRSSDVTSVQNTAGAVYENMYVSEMQTGYQAVAGVQLYLMKTIALTAEFKYRALEITDLKLQSGDLMKGNEGDILSNPNTGDPISIDMGGITYTAGLTMFF